MHWPHSRSRLETAPQSRAREVFRHVAREVKVVLTGDGGDELFAGYGRYRQAARFPYVPFADRLVRPLDRLPAWRRVQQARRAGRVLGTRRGARYRALVEVFSPHERHLLLGHASFVSQLPDGGSSDPDAALTSDLGAYLPDDLLVKTDITSMAASLEARCPLLNHVLAEWVVPMPIDSKQDRVRGKRLLEAATRDLLPPEAYRRPKRGFGSPVEQWLRGPLRQLFEDTVMAPRAHVGDWFDRRSLRKVGRDVLAGRGNAHQAWALLALEIWSRSSVAGSPDATMPDANDSPMHGTAR